MFEIIKKFILVTLWCIIFIYLAEIFEDVATRSQILLWRQVVLYMIFLGSWCIIGPDKKSISQVIKEQKALKKQKPSKFKNIYYFYILTPISIWLYYLHI